MTGSAEWRMTERSQEPFTGHLIVAGLNYHSSPIAIRERFIIPEYCLAHALHGLARFPHIKESVVLSTCNRTEVYAVVTDIQAGIAEVESFFLSAQTIADHGSLRPNFRLLRDDVALHLFRVASGLDSMVLGEGQIMAQVKGALKAAQNAGTVGSCLEQLFELALSCGKRVRTETSMSRRAVSVSSAAVELAREVRADLGDSTVLLVGAGRMAKICAKHLLNEGGSGRVIMINRTAERVEQFAKTRLPAHEKLICDFDFSERHHLAAAADVVIVSTSAPEFVLTREKFSRLHDGRPIIIIDISAPRNVDPEIGELPGVQLYHTDDLSRIVDRNLAERERLVADAEKIVFETLGSFHAWQRSLLVVPTIAGLRKKIEAIRAEQIRKTCRAFAGAAHEDMEQVEQLSRAIVNRILHHPTVQLKATSDQQLLVRQAQALQTLFELDVFERDLQ